MFVQIEKVGGLERYFGTPCYRNTTDFPSGDTPIYLCQRRIRMSHQVRLSDDVYERIKSHKREDETFSEAVDRLIGGRSLRDLRDVFDDDQVTAMREAIEDADREDRQAVREVAERFE